MRVEPVNERSCAACQRTFIGYRGVCDRCYRRLTDDNRGRRALAASERWWRKPLRHRTRRAA